MEIKGSIKTPCINITIITFHQVFFILTFSLMKESFHSLLFFDQIWSQISMRLSSEMQIFETMNSFFESNMLESLFQYCLANFS